MKEFKNHMGEMRGDLKLDAGTIDLFYERYFHGISFQEHPRIIVLAGSPGSGKTTYRTKYLYKAENYHIHDMDDVLINLPGYQKDLKTKGKLMAFNLWMKQARIIADKIVDFAMKHNFNIIYDRTCGADDSYIALRFAKTKLNYYVDFYGFYVDLNKAVHRVDSRGKTQPRIVGEQLVYEYCAKFSAFWPYYIEFIDNAVLFDTETWNLKQIYSSCNGIIDEKKYKKFLSLGEQMVFSKNFQVFQCLLKEGRI